jgi:ferric-dicitrate binding protein FerR (iron transport regulator)
MMTLPQISGAAHRAEVKTGEIRVSQLIDKKAGDKTRRMAVDSQNHEVSAGEASFPLYELDTGCQLDCERHEVWPGNEFQPAVSEEPLFSDGKSGTRGGINSGEYSTEVRAFASGLLSQSLSGSAKALETGI